MISFYLTFDVISHEQHRLLKVWFLVDSFVDRFAKALLHIMVLEWLFPINLVFWLWELGEMHLGIN